MKLLAGDFAIDQIDPYFLQRVEVLGGPASVLYGQASPGGLVNMVSKQPTSAPFHEVELQTGSYGRMEGAFDFSGPIDQDGQFLYRLTGLGLDTSTQVDHTKDQRLAIAPAFTWKPDADTSLTILMNYQHDPAGGWLDIGLPARGTVLPNPNGKIPTSLFTGDPDFSKFDRTQYSVGYLFEHRLNDTWTIRQNFRYNHVDADYQDLYDRGLEADSVTLNRGTIFSLEHLDAFTVDNQAEAKFDTGPFRHTFLMGIDYQHMLWNQQEGAGAGPTLNVFAPVYGQPIAVPPTVLKNSQTLDQTGFYFQDQIRFEHWAFMLGGREDWAGSNTQNVLNSTDTPQFNRAFTKRAGIVYLFDDGIAPYVSYSESFQPTGGTDFSGSPFRPTTGQQEEVGIKYQPPGSNSFVSAAAYNLVEQNVLTNDPQHPGFSVQTGEITGQGIELQAHASVTDNLSLIGAYTYLSAVNTKSNSTGTTIGGITESTQGKTPINVPSQMASLWGEYTFHNGQARGLGLGAGVRYVGSSYGDTVDSFKVPGFALFDAALQYDLGALNPAIKGVEFQLNATNLFNKQYVSGCNSANGCFYGIGRTVLATLKYQW